MPAGTKPGYTLGRDERGLTAREREVLSYLVQSKQLVEIAALMGVAKQRVGQIVAALERKKVVVKKGDTYVIRVHRNS